MVDSFETSSQSVPERKPKIGGFTELKQLFFNKLRRRQVEEQEIPQILPPYIKDGEAHVWLRDEGKWNSKGEQDPSKREKLAAIGSAVHQICDQFYEPLEHDEDLRDLAKSNLKIPQGIFLFGDMESVLRAKIDDPNAIQEDKNLAARYLEEGTRKHTSQEIFVSPEQTETERSVVVYTKTSVKGSEMLQKIEYKVEENKFPDADTEAKHIWFVGHKTSGVEILGDTDQIIESAQALGMSTSQYITHAGFDAVYAISMDHVENRKYFPFEVAGLTNEKNLM